MTIEAMPRGPVQARSQQKQARLLTAVQTLVNRHELEHIRVVDIAAEAGVATGTVYQRFRDKEALLRAVLDRFAGEMQARVCAGVAVAAETRDPAAMVAALSAAMVREYRENRGLMKAATRFWGDGHSVGGPVKNMAVAIGHDLLQQFEPFLQAFGHEHPKRAISQALQFMFGILMFEAATDAGPLRLGEPYIEQELSHMFCRYCGLAEARA